MALNIFFSLLAVTISLLLTTTDIASSRSLSTSPKTTFLDVASALQQTQHILSLDMTPSSLATIRPESDPVSLDSSSQISLKIHSRDTLAPSQYKDYNSLVLSRLKRDSSRVAGITARLQTYKDNIITTPLFSAGIPEYVTRIGVGTPPKEMYMFIDTGSDVNWIQCVPCTKCYNQSDPLFDPASSSTYKPLPCSSTQCASLATSATPSCSSSGKCLYTAGYSDGSFSKGEFVTDTVTFGNTGGTFEGIALGCGHDNGGDFINAAGLIGLGGGNLSMTSQIQATSFSYCLVDRNSRNPSTLEFNSADISDVNDVTAKLLRNEKIPTFYYVGISGFSVGGQQVSIPASLFELDGSGNGGVILDCGTDLAYLHTHAYNSLRDAFVKAAADLKRSTMNFKPFDTCYDLAAGPATAVIPTVTVHFTSGKSFDFHARNTLVPVDNVGTFCLAFLPTSSPMSILGNVLQVGTRVTYDLANNVIGFSPNKC